MMTMTMKKKRRRRRRREEGEKKKKEAENKKEEEKGKLYKMLSLVLQLEFFGAFFGFFRRKTNQIRKKSRLT